MASFSNNDYHKIVFVDVFLVLSTTVLNDIYM